MGETEEVELVGYLSIGDKDGDGIVVNMNREDEIIMIYTKGKDGFYLSFPEAFFKTALKEIGFWMD